MLDTPTDKSSLERCNKANLTKTLQHLSNAKLVEKIVLDKKGKILRAEIISQFAYIQQITPNKAEEIVDIELSRRNKKVIIKLDKGIYIHAQNIKKEPIDKPIEETNDEELEIKIERAIKEILWKKEIEDSDIYSEEDLIFGDEIDEMMKKNSSIIGYELISINEAFGKNLTNDQNFISEIAMKVGEYPNNPNFKKRLWKCFSKIKIASITQKI